MLMDESDTSPDWMNTSVVVMGSSSADANGMALAKRKAADR